MKISSTKLAKSIDHTFLKPFGAPEDIERLCNEAKKHGFGCVMVHPVEVTRCRVLLKDSDVYTGTVAGFPLGQNTVAIKDAEVANVLNLGAEEVDLVLNVRALQARQADIVRKELNNLSERCRKVSAVSKVILETCYLTNAQIVEACTIAQGEGVDFVKTSTGFGEGGATVEHIELMRRTVGVKMGVKASGGIRDLDTAEAMMRAGATRLGTSSGVQIIERLLARGMGKDLPADANTSDY